MKTLERCLIGLAGPAGVGKTTLAQWLVEAFGGTRLRFADGLKCMLRALPGVTSEHFDGALKNEPLEILGGKTARHAMQTLGTTWGRGCIDEQFWVRVLRAQVLKCSGLVVVDDVRFPNEAREIIALGGRVFELRRDGVCYTGGHASEQTLPMGLTTPLRLTRDAPPFLACYVAERLRACGNSQIE